MNGPMTPMTEPSHLRTPDGRSLDLYVAGPDGGGTLVFFPGSPGSGRLGPPGGAGPGPVGGGAPAPAEGLDCLAGMGAEIVEEFESSLAGPEAMLPRMDAARAAYVSITGDEVAAALGALGDEVDRASITGEFAEAVASGFREGLREGYWGWFDEDLMFVRPSGFDLASIRVPVHIWQGRHDRMGAYAHGRGLGRAGPRGAP